MCEYLRKHYPRDLNSISGVFYSLSCSNPKNEMVVVSSVMGCKVLARRLMMVVCVMSLQA